MPLLRPIPHDLARPGVTLRLLEVDLHTATFDIEVDPWLQGQGLGSAVLEDLCLLADELGLALAIIAEPTPDGGPTQARLMRWYARFGFERVGWHGRMHRLVERH